MSQGCGFSPVRVAGTSPWRPRCHFLPGSPGPGPAQAGRDRSDVTARRLSPVRRHIATVTAAAAPPGTGQRTGPRRRLRPVRHPGNRRPGRALIRQRSLQKSRTHVTTRRFQSFGNRSLVPLGEPRRCADGTRLARVSLSIGIVGLPNVGKSTLFNALTRASALASNYPFATIEPNVGVVGVPDPRLAKLAALYDSARIVPASVRFTDIAGLVRGASQGQGLGNQFLAHIRETDAICQVVRVFADPDVTHVDGDVAPERDIETVVTELILADLQTLEKALPRLAKETKFSKDPERLEVAAAAEAAVGVLDSGTTLYAGAAPAGISLRA